MKLYVLPVERACDARCSFCITDFRDAITRKQFLDVAALEKVLRTIEVEKIEITGGGEPTLHPALDTIIDLCTAKAPTQLYTHGARITSIQSIPKLQYLCISRAHYDDQENERIMGIKYDMGQLQPVKVPLKFSLLLHRSGIHTLEEVQTYLAWAQDKAQKVVLRQLFEHDHHKNTPQDTPKIDGEYVSSETLFQNLNIRSFQQTASGNPVFSYGRLEVEVEFRSCACEMNNPVLHADGKLYKGWSNELQ